MHELIGRLREHADLEISTMDGIEENVRFSLPDILNPAPASG